MIMTVYTKRVKMLCGACGYKWEARVKEPKECPSCKSRYWGKKGGVVERVERGSGGSEELGGVVSVVVAKRGDGGEL